MNPREQSRHVALEALLKVPPAQGVHGSPDDPAAHDAAATAIWEHVATMISR